VPLPVFPVAAKIRPVGSLLRRLLFSVSFEQDTSNAVVI
jgi:hypothetical protein